MNPSDWNGSMEGDGEANAPVKSARCSTQRDWGHRRLCHVYWHCRCWTAPARVGIIEEKSPRAGFSSRQYKTELNYSADLPC